MEVDSGDGAPEGKAKADGKDNSDRKRSRSLRDAKKASTVDAYQDVVTVLDCGDEGRCGYQCIAAALSLAAGQDFAAVKGLLLAKGRTAFTPI